MGGQFLKYCSDLSIATQVLLDPDYRMPERKVTLGYRFFPQSSTRLKSLGEISDHFLDGTSFYIQTKLDGWRMLMHYDMGNLTWYSRSNEDFSNLYGKDASSGSMALSLTNLNNKPVIISLVVIFDGSTEFPVSSFYSILCFKDVPIVAPLLKR
jgi:ATP-dependent DNA ligase